MNSEFISDPQRCTEHTYMLATCPGTEDSVAVMWIQLRGLPLGSLKSYRGTNI